VRAPAGPPQLAQSVKMAIRTSLPVSYRGAAHWDEIGRQYTAAQFIDPKSDQRRNTGTAPTIEVTKRNAASP
jgi:hypothetical protein